MSETPPQRFLPMLVYKNELRAIEFLCDAFGFKENSRLDMLDRRVGHAHLEYLGHTVTLSSEYEEMGLVSPQSQSAIHCQIQYRVDDVNTHFEEAKAKGMTIVEGTRISLEHRVASPLWRRPIPCATASRKGRSST